MTKQIRFLFFSLVLLAAPLTLRADDTWQSVVAKMPLNTNVTELNRFNTVKIMLPAFQSNDVVKALIFMPGATDEFNMFRRAKAHLTNDNPSILDAIVALTNQTYIRATFRPPFLLLHTDEDPLDTLITVKDFATASRLEGRPFLSHALFVDRDWDYLLPILHRKTGASFVPIKYSRDSWHFYRHSLSAWNLNSWEALQAIALAGETKYTIEHNHIIFDADTRVMARPKLDNIHIGE